jgi:GT2 family glycosyltransferase
MKNSNPRKPTVQRRIAVIVCTIRGRATLAALLNSICRCNTIPAVLVIVDASSHQTAENLDYDSFGGAGFKVIRIDSSRGLPHQRNNGLEFVVSQEEFRDCDIFSFLDDDVEVGQNYFEELVRCFDSFHDLVCVGATDSESQLRDNPSLALRLAMVTSRSCGKVLTSGFATLPKSDTVLSSSEWVPGFAFSFRRSVFQSHRFDDRILFYGEDLEFQLRISQLGRIGISNRLHVSHRQSPLLRDSIRDHWSFTDGFRWSMTKRFPGRVKKSAVIWSTIALMILEAGRFVRHGAHRPPYELLGHLDFFRRLVSFSEVEKIREEL